MVEEALEVATDPDQMNLPGLNLHKLQADLKGFYAVNVSGNWRIIFAFEGKDAVSVN